VTGTAHSPVMLEEATSLLQPRDGGLYCDATVGGGGHAEQVLRLSSPGGRLVGIDRDPEALERARRRLEPFGQRVQLINGNYADAAEILGRLGCVAVDGFLLDLGLSSDQLQEPTRGFSFQQPGPLDMRFDRTRGAPASELLSRLRLDDLARLLAEWGEQPAAMRIARAILRERDAGRLGTTSELAAVVARAAPRRGRTHPATRVFQALRIAVNDELGSLTSFLRSFCELLRPRGRVVVIAFHSLEDRLVKHRLRELSARRGDGPVLTVLTRRPLRPGGEEVRANPRARSARLRAAERLPDSGARDTEAVT